MAFPSSGSIRRTARRAAASRTASPSGACRYTPALLAEGLLEYVADLPKDGPLFPKVTPDRFGKRGGNGTKTLGRWVREKVGITDKRKAPNHSWRHRFEDQCRKVGVSREIRFAIQGHSVGAVGDTYGSEGYPLKVLAAAIEKLPNPLDEPDP